MYVAKCPTWVGWTVLLIVVVAMPLAASAVRRFHRQASGEDGLGLGMAGRAGLTLAALGVLGVLGAGLLLGWPRWVLGALGAGVAALLLAVVLSSLRTLSRLDDAARIMLDTARHTRAEGEGGSPWRS